MSTKIKTPNGWKNVATNNASGARNPDYARKIELTSTQLRNGYTVPEDGFITGSVATPNSGLFNEIWTLNVLEGNTTICMAACFSGNELTVHPVHILLSRGQAIKQSSNAQFDAIYSHLYFVPYKTN